METKTLKIHEVYTLRNEINLMVKEKVKQIFKLDLSELFDECQRILKPVEEARVELVRQYLQDEIAQGKKPEECTEYKQFEAELTEILAQDRDINYRPIKRSYLEFDSERFYPIIGSLLEKQHVETPA